MDAKSAFAEEINRGRSYVALNSMGTMDLISTVHQNWFNAKVLDDEYVMRRLQSKSYSFITHVLEVKISEHVMYVVVDNQKDYLEMYYANFTLFMVSSDNYTAIDDGSSLGKQLPSYLSIESTGDYFNYMVQVQNVCVPYEFFVILHDMHDKIKTL